MLEICFFEAHGEVSALQDEWADWDENFDEEARRRLNPLLGSTLE